MASVLPFHAVDIRQTRQRGFDSLREVYVKKLQDRRADFDV